MQIFAKEWVEYPFNPIALASTAITKELSGTLSLTLGVNRTLAIALVSAMQKKQKFLAMILSTTHTTLVNPANF